MQFMELPVGFAPDSADVVLVQRSAVSEPSPADEINLDPSVASPPQAAPETDGVFVFDVFSCYRSLRRNNRDRAMGQRGCVFGSNEVIQLP